MTFYKWNDEEVQIKKMFEFFIKVSNQIIHLNEKL
jgi:hypothetical protein